MSTLDNAREKEEFVFNYPTRVTNRGESIVVRSLIISSSFNHDHDVCGEFSLTLSGLVL